MNMAYVSRAFLLQYIVRVYFPYYFHAWNIRYKFYVIFFVGAFRFIVYGWNIAKLYRDEPLKRYCKINFIGVNKFLSVEYLQF